MAKGKKIRRSSYSYRRRKNKTKKTIIYILVVILLVAIGYFSAKLIFGRNDVRSGQDEASSQISKVTSDSAKQQDANDTKSEPQQENIVKAYVMSYDDLTDKEGYDTFLQTAKDKGYNSVVIDLKDENGVVYYNSSVEFAVAKDVISDNAVDLKDLLDAVNKAGLTPIARIVTLQDNLASYGSDATFLYEDTLSRWLDGVPGNGGKGWLNPYTQKARDYITALCGEISEAGFKTIILDKLQFPSNMSSHTNTLNENNISKSEILKQLADEIKAKVEANKTEVICQFTAESSFDINSGIYGGTPSDITSGAVALTVDEGVFKSADLTQEFENLDFDASPKDSFLKLAEYICKTNDSVMFVTDGSTFEAVKDLTNDNGIKGFVVN